MSLQKRLFWTPVQLVSYAGILTGILFPNWWNSYSFILSWAAALALTLFSFPYKAIGAYIVMFPLILPFSLLHPLSILFNILFAPVIGSILLPLSMLSYLFNIFSFISDFCWKIFQMILDKSAILFEIENLNLKPTTFYWAWIYILLLHFFAQFFKKKHKK